MGSTQRGANRNEVTIVGNLDDAKSRLMLGHLWLATDALADLPVATPRVLTLLNGSNTECAVKIDVRASAAVRVDLYEGPSYSVIGTAVTVTNENRNNAATAKVKVYHTPTVATDGTAILSQYSGAGALNQPIEPGCIVLKADTVYLLRLTALDDDAVATINLQFEDDASGSAATSSTTTTTTTSTTTTT